MINDTPDDDILERLRHPELEAEREARRHHPDKLFMLRNILNVIFILMAVVAMVGISVAWWAGTGTAWCYVLGLVAVLIKMVEAMLRMPNLLHKNQVRHLPHPHTLQAPQSPTEALQSASPLTNKNVQPSQSSASHTEAATSTDEAANIS